MIGHCDKFVLNFRCSLGITQCYEQCQNSARLCCGDLGERPNREYVNADIATISALYGESKMISDLFNFGVLRVVV